MHKQHCRAEAAGLRELLPLVDIREFYPLRRAWRGGGERDIHGAVATYVTSRTNFRTPSYPKPYLLVVVAVGRRGREALRERLERARTERFATGKT